MNSQVSFKKAITMLRTNKSFSKYEFYKSEVLSLLNYINNSNLKDKSILFQLASNKITY